VAEVEESIHDKVHFQKVSLKEKVFGLHMKEGRSLKAYLDELNLILMELYNIKVKVDDEDATIIILSFLPPYENLVSSLSVGDDCFTLEKLKSSLYMQYFHLLRKLSMHCLLGW